MNWDYLCGFPYRGKIPLSGISALNHCMSWSKFVNTHLYHSRQWFNIRRYTYYCGSPRQSRLPKYICSKLTYYKTCSVLFLIWRTYQYLVKIKEQTMLTVHVQLNFLLWKKQKTSAALH